MKSVLRFVFAALVLSCVSFLTACGEHGGTIIVKNNYEKFAVDVTVYSGLSPSGQTLYTYKDEYGPKTIAAGGSADFSVSSDDEYGIRVYSEIKKRVYVSGGDTVEVTIP
ncbi:MAG: hypothetical protein LBU18_02840 [Treponema sp.]|jgi:hypothetical protein|nr:hypothetical protein [Treponema sp.]